MAFPCVPAIAMLIFLTFNYSASISARRIAGIFLFNAVMALILVINSQEIISIVYEIGMFSNDDVIRVSSIMKIVALGVVPWSINQIVNRSYYVQKRYWFPVGIGTLGTLATTLALLISNSNFSDLYFQILIVHALISHHDAKAISCKSDWIKILFTTPAGEKLL